MFHICIVRPSTTPHMKRETQIQSIDGNTVKMIDGTTWLVGDPHNAPHALPHWQMASRVETEDFGIDTYILHISSGEEAEGEEGLTTASGRAWAERVTVS